MRKLLTFALLLASILTSCLPGASPTESSAPAESPWWGDAVFYEIFVRSFYDSNGDGIGDFNGITEKLDYLNDGDPATTDDLGVTGIWLMPIFPSPSYHGYDVTDYYAVNPQYGTMEDFKRLLEEAHKRDIRIIIDLVINHTSDQHPWFREAKRDKKSKYRDWYLWNETDPGYRGPWNERVWHSSTTGFYYGIFTANMPDLNYNNREVTREIENVMEFWLADVGVDGFRMDAIKHLIEDGQVQENTQATHEWLQKNFYPAYKRLNPEALVVGELFGNDMNSIDKYVGNRQFDMAFNFQLASSILSSANSRSASYASRAMELSNKVLDPSQYAPFLTNHDQDRIMSELLGDVDKAKVAASLLLTSPGTPFLYYGEEIGMQGRKPDENIRLPMQWSDVKNGGFTTGKPWRAINSDYTDVNVLAQQADTDSLFNHYRALIQLRNAQSALRSPGFAVVDSGQNRLFASLRFGEQQAVLVLINTGAEPIRDFTIALDQSTLAPGEAVLTSLLGPQFEWALSIQQDGGFSFEPGAEIPPYATVVLEFKIK